MDWNNEDLEARRSTRRLLQRSVTRGAMSTEVGRDVKSFKDDSETYQICSLVSRRK